MDFAGKEGIELPDDLLDSVAGGVYNPFAYHVEPEEPFVPEPTLPDFDFDPHKPFGEN